MKDQKKYHKHHIVKPSPWGGMTGLGIGGIAIGIASRIQRRETGYMIILVIVGIGIPIWMWGRDIVRESSYIGKHTKEVSKGIRIGFGWLLVTEVMFFIGVIMTYLYSRGSATIWIGGTWPDEITWTRKSLTNTICLLTSGYTLTICHKNLIRGRIWESQEKMKRTIQLGMVFILIQINEYIESKWQMIEGIGGSCFYLTTGFHGLHVICGIILLLISYLRLKTGTMTWKRNVGITTYAWYWHFVDVVWIVLYILVYII